MGGGATAFEDDPVSVWCNPAGMATQQTGASFEVQTYVVYRRNDAAVPPTHFSADAGFNDPALVPTYVGAVIQVGTVDRPQAVGISFVSPVLLRMAYDAEDDAFSPNTWTTSQRFSRFRLAYARDFKFRAAGEEGLFPHLSIGLGMDLGMTTMRMEDPFIDQDRRKSKNEFGAGFGFLLCAFDNTRNLKVNIAGAYQTSIAFDLVMPVTSTGRNAPTLNWPDQIQVGALVYLLEGLPLKISAEFQFVDWRNACPGSDVPGVDRFTRSTVASVGGEYRLPLTSSIVLYPRAGVRFFDAPWATREKAGLPGVGEWQLRITTHAERFTVLCAGFGLSLLGQGGGVTTLSVTVEFGEDAPSVAAGVVVVF